MSEEEKTTLSSTSEDGKKTDTTPAGESSTQDGGKNNDGDDVRSKFIPRERFDEVNDLKKEYEEKLAKIDADNKKREQDEALKRGEHETVISQKEAEISDLKTQLESAKTYESKLKGISENSLESFKTNYGEEAYKKALTLIGSEDPLIVLEKLPAIEDFYKDKKQSIPTGGSKQPGSGGAGGKLAEYQERIAKGEKLGSREQAEYFQLVLK